MLKIELERKKPDQSASMNREAESSFISREDAARAGSAPTQISIFQASASSKTDPLSGRGFDKEWEIAKAISEDKTYPNAKVSPVDKSERALFLARTFVLSSFEHCQGRQVLFSLSAVMMSLPQFSEAQSIKLCYFLLRPISLFSENSSA